MGKEKYFFKRYLVMFIMLGWNGIWLFGDHISKDIADVGCG
jgi:hypothetical protein